MAKSLTSDTIILGSPKAPVRLSFARLFTPKAFQQGQDPRYEATFLLDPTNAEHAAAFAKVKAEASKLIQQSGVDPKSFKFCWGKGDDKPYDGYAGMIYLASNNKTPPSVVDRGKNELKIENGREPKIPYSGCYVVGSVRLWLQNNQFGKRINANLRAVWYINDGPAFGAGAVDAEKEFEALEDAPGASNADPFDL